MSSTNQSSLRELTSPAKLDSSLSVIRASFQTVADQFGLTPQNCPTRLLEVDSAGLAVILALSWV